MPGTAVTQKDEGGLLYIEAQVTKIKAAPEDKHCQLYGMIDTGSNVSIIAMELVTQLAIDLTDKVLPYTGVGNADMGSVTTAHIALSIRDEVTGAVWRITQEVGVKASMAGPQLIIGLDILKNLDIEMKAGEPMKLSWG